MKFVGSVEQGFSKWVTGHPGVPRRQSRGGATRDNLIIFGIYLDTFKLEVHSYFQSRITRRCVLVDLLFSLV